MDYKEFKQKHDEVGAVINQMENAYYIKKDEIIEKMLIDNKIDVELGKNAKKLFDNGYILTTIADGEKEHIAITKIVDYVTIDNETIYNSLPQTKKGE